MQCIRIGNIVRLSGRFDFDTHRLFRRVTDEVLKSTDTTIVLDLKHVVYMDSAALGMLLVLRDRATPLNKICKLVVTPGRVSQTLEIASFSKLFEIES